MSNMAKGGHAFQWNDLAAGQFVMLWIQEGVEHTHKTLMTDVAKWQNPCLVKSQLMIENRSTKNIPR